jgi:hypothetical protein
MAAGFTVLGRALQIDVAEARSSWPSGLETIVPHADLLPGDIRLTAMLPAVAARVAGPGVKFGGRAGHRDIVATTRELAALR